MRLTLALACTLALTLGLAACGGGSRDTAPGTPGPARAAAAQAAAALATLATTAHGTPPRRALEAGPRTAAAASPEAEDAANDAADQLLDFAEVHFPEYFPGHPASANLDGYRYRLYATGIYLAVRAGQVYVLGGSFGTEVVAAGPLTQFITPRPLVRSGVCSQAGAVVAGFATPAPAVGKNAAVTLAGCAGPVAGPVWRQTAGPVVRLLSDKSQTLSFEPPEPGAYAFRVDFIDPLGSPRSELVAFSAAPAASGGASLVLRASHSVRAGGKVSVRAWPTLPEGDAVKAVTWAQIEGPPVTLDTRTSRLALFTAPAVARDTVLRLRATLHTTQGHTDSDEVLVLVEAHPQAAASEADALWAGEHVSRVYPYVSGSAYAGALQRCVFDPGTYVVGPLKNSCRLSELPLLAQQTRGEPPTVEQVMARVLVSHDWVGRNFEALLRAHDPHGDFRRLLGSVTAIVLSTAVRPSYYHPATGAIYLDAENFWLDAEERDTLNEAPDYRSEFGNALQFTDLWRYVREGRSLYPYYDPRQRVTRTLDAVRDEAVALLYHELGHAADYLPASAQASLSNARTVWDNIVLRYNRFQVTSDVVSYQYPLGSDTLRGLSAVMFAGATPTEAQRAMTPVQVGALFEADLATDLYAYDDPAEDVAMLLEEALLQHRLGIRRDVAFTDPIASGAGASSVLVRWGQRGRIGEPALRPRARATVQALMPWVEPDAVDSLPPPHPMRLGESWAANLGPPAMPRLAQPLQARPTLLQLWQFQQELQRMHQHRHTPGRRFVSARAAGLAAGR